MFLSFYFAPFNFVKNLIYMLTVMLGVFMIVAIIMAATYLIAHFTSKKPKNKDNNKQ